MREYIISSLILFFAPSVWAQTVPAGWQVIKDSKNACQIAVPSEWSAMPGAQGAAVFQDNNTALAIVTSQPGQEFAPLTPGVINALEIPKDRLFENSRTRIFYQDRKASGKGDPNSYSFSVPGKGGICSGHINFTDAVTVDVVKKIALSLAPVGGGASN